MDIEPVTLKLDRAEDLLAYLPYRFGYVPTQSLAMLTVIEPAPGEVAVGMASRLDLADLATPTVLPQAVAGIRAQMLQDPTVGALTVVYADEPIADIRAGQGVAGGVLEEWLAQMPFTDRREAFIVTPTGYACLECAHVPHCPYEGYPLSRLTESAVAARMVLEGESLAPSREALGCPRDVDAERLAAAIRAADRERRAMRKRPGDQQQRWRRRILDLFGVALAEAMTQRRWLPDPAVLGRLGAAMADPHLRDAVVAWTVSGERGRPGSDDVLANFGGMVTGEVALPDGRHRQAARLVLTEIVRHAGPRRAGYPLAMLGWLAWWSGEGARADVLVHQCLSEDPGCSLGSLLVDVLHAGVRPGWVGGRSCVTPSTF
ncbi:DUF4192 domain-containing protein [Pseudactinotalea sp.]|uniref:DUF4192 domain-containing protein n=1 Tax=Pseudactinotalea sp. TaxID=1926260 RepID=UPI003B3A3387